MKLDKTLKVSLLGIGLAAGITSVEARIPAPWDCDAWLTALNRCEAGEPTNVSNCRFYYDGWMECRRG